MSSSSENLPLGLMTQPVSAAGEIPPEPPDVAARTLGVASRLLCGATTFFFVAYLFAFIYLRSLDQNHLWHEGHMKLSQGLGAGFIACVVLSAAATILAGRGMRAGSPSWLTAAIAGVLLGLLAVALQCIEYTSQNFGPTDGAYASVFTAWSAFYLIAVLGTMYWLETMVATEARARRAPAGSGDVKDVDLLIAPGLDAVVFYWTFLACIGIVTYVTLYLVK
jgi:heme/copper-type cytochrome/quinol oxidase subunit 3